MNNTILNLADWFTGAELYYSSARRLARVLKKKNIKLDKKVFYEYVLPDKQISAMYEKKIQMAEFLYLYRRGDLKRWIRDGDIDFVSESEIAKIEQYIYSHKDVAKNRINNDTKVIKKLNACLSDIQTRSKFNKIDLLCGAIYGFAPDEIRYFVSRSASAKNNDLHRMQKLEEKLGYCVGYILAPETQMEIESKLIKINNRIG